MDLFDATLSKDIKKFSAKQIYILGRKGQKDLLAESDDEKDAREWGEAIAAHIRYANTINNADPEASLNRSISMKSKLSIFHLFSLFLKIYFPFF